MEAEVFDIKESIRFALKARAGDVAHALTEICRDFSLRVEKVLRNSPEGRLQFIADVLLFFVPNGPASYLGIDTPAGETFVQKFLDSTRFHILHSFNSDCDLQGEARKLESAEVIYYCLNSLGLLRDNAAGAIDVVAEHIEEFAAETIHQLAHGAATADARIGELQQIVHSLESIAELCIGAGREGVKPIFDTFSAATRRVEKYIPSSEPLDELRGAAPNIFLFRQIVPKKVSEARAWTFKALRECPSAHAYALGGMTASQMLLGGRDPSMRRCFRDIARTDDQNCRSLATLYRSLLQNVKECHQHLEYLLSRIDYSVKSSEKRKDWTRSILKDVFNLSKGVGLTEDHFPGLNDQNLRGKTGRHRNEQVQRFIMNCKHWQLGFADAAIELANMLPPAEVFHPDLVEYLEKNPTAGYTRSRLKVDLVKIAYILVEDLVNGIRWCGIEVLPDFAARVLKFLDAHRMWNHLRARLLTDLVDENDSVKVWNQALLVRRFCRHLVEAYEEDITERDDIGTVIETVYNSGSFEAENFSEVVSPELLKRMREDFRKIVLLPGQALESRMRTVIELAGAAQAAA